MSTRSGLCRVPARGNGPSLPENATDHIALLSLMIAGTLIRRLDEVGQLDDATARQLHQLVLGVRRHATSRGLSDLNILFDNIDRTLGRRLESTGAV